MATTSFEIGIKKKSYRVGDIRAMSVRAGINPGRGADATFLNRPGVPMEASPKPLKGVHWRSPEKQKSDIIVFKRVGLAELTPVFGTCQPPKALSGILRASAYKIPEHVAMHWGLLLIADRIDVLEGRLRDGFTRKPFWGILISAAGIAGATLFLKNKKIINRRLSNGKI